jgi:hypothetical protein
VLASHLANPRLLPGMLQIAETDGAIQGCVLVRPSRIQIDGAILECGIMTVAPANLDPDLLEPLLAGCLAALVDTGATLVFVEGLAHSLAQFGLATYRYHTELSLPTILPTLRPYLRPVTAADHDDIAALYDATYRLLPYSELRSPADWRSWPMIGTAFACEDGRGWVIGYLLLSDQRVIEAGAADAGAARMLIAALAGAASWLHLPMAHPITQAALHMGGELHIRASQPQEHAPLAGVLDLAGIFAQLLPVCERRLAGSRYDRWSGTLGIAMHHEQIVLVFTNGQAMLLSGTNASDVWLRRVSLGGLAQLLLGYRSCADLRATRDLACDDTALGLLDVLFPIMT